MKKILIITATTSLLLGIIGLSLSANNRSKPNFANGARLWSMTCNRCHEMRSMQDYKKDIWHSVGQHMRIRAGLTGQDTRDIIEFLKMSAPK